MDYKNYQEFLDELKVRDTHNHIHLITWAWFHLANDGTMWMEIDAKVPMVGNMVPMMERKQVHPSFAWGIYQLMSNLNAQQL
jgi:hypothetical protein